MWAIRIDMYTTDAACHRVGPNTSAIQFFAPIQDGRINDESTIDAANTLYVIANAQLPENPVVDPRSPQ